jgi:hypothetical protein
MSIKLETIRKVTYTCSWCKHVHESQLDPSAEDPDAVPLPLNWLWIAISGARTLVPKWSLVCQFCTGSLNIAVNTAWEKLQSEIQTADPTDGLEPVPDSFSDQTTVGTTIERCHEVGSLEPVRFCCLPAGHDPKVPHQFTRKP